jgi:hypothetical protein
VKGVPALRKTLHEQFNDLDGHRTMRIVTVVPGLQYVGKVLSVGSDHVVLATEFDVVTVALSHIVSAQKERA